MKFSTAASLAVLVAVSVPSWALAQDASDDSEEIVVTAQKRKQRLQDVPIVVTSINKKQLQDAGVRDVKDLMQVTPGLVVTSNANEAATTVRIRGIGTVGDNPGLEASVGIVVDGVYRPRGAGGIGDLGELDRVEVLKGPQGTLFGKNTSAGVVNVLTAAPDFDFTADAVLTVGNYNAREASVAVNGTIIEDKLAGRLYVASRERDGFYDVVTGNGPRTNTEDQNRNYYTIRGQLLFEASEDLSFKLIGDYTERRETCCAAVTYRRGASQAYLDRIIGMPATLNPIDPESRVAYANRDGLNTTEDQGFSLEANYNTPWLGGATITSITAWRNWEFDLINQESDFSRADILYRDRDDAYHTGFEQFSQEFRFAGEAGNLNWLVGAFYANEKLDQVTGISLGQDLERFMSLVFSGGASQTFLADRLGLTPGTVLPGNASTRDYFSQTSESFALFTNNSYKITDALELTVGLRYTSEDKSLEADYNAFGIGNGCATYLANPALLPPSALGVVCHPLLDTSFDGFSSQQDRSAEEVTGTAKLAYRFNDDLMVYGSYARGYKSAGFNLDRARIAPGTPEGDTYFPGEFVDSYEIGAKTTWFDGDLLLNLSGFYQEFEGYQINVYNGLSYSVNSIPSVKSIGIDSDFIWRAPVEGLTFTGGLTYANTRYGDFIPASGVPPLLPGRRLAFAPLLSGNVAANYETDVSEALRLSLNLSYRYSSDYMTGQDLTDVRYQKAFGMINARVGLGAIDDKWRLEAWGANLTDETVAQVIFDPAFQTGTAGAILAPPRTYGLTLRVSY